MNYLLVYDHVLGSTSDPRAQAHGPYTYEHPFNRAHGVPSGSRRMTHALRIGDGILIRARQIRHWLPRQRRSRRVEQGEESTLGIGIGWNYV